MIVLLLLGQLVNTSINPKSQILLVDLEGVYTDIIIYRVCPTLLYNIAQLGFSQNTTLIIDSINSHDNSGMIKLLDSSCL